MNTMRHSTLRLLPLLICLGVMCGCNDKKASFTLKGHIQGLPNDTLLIYGADDWYDQLDSVPVHNGHFKYKIAVDTVTPLWVAFPNGYRTMLIAEKNTTTTLTGDSAADGRFTLKGGTQNTILQEFYTLALDSTLTQARLLEKADSFITNHPFDEASIVLMRKFYADVPSPSQTKIRSLVGALSGNLQDNNYLVTLNRAIDATKSSVVNAGRFTLHDTINKTITPTLFSDSCLLISFWASYDENSRIQQRTCRALADTFANRPIVFLSISLDLIREEWLRAIHEDSTTALVQTNEFNGWGLDLARQFGVRSLPWNVLTNAQRRIVANNIYGDSLQKKITEVVELEEKRKKEELERKEEEKKKKRKKK